MKKKLLGLALILILLAFPAVPAAAAEEESAAPGFTDIAFGEWYAAPALWAKDNGIVGDCGGGRFGVGQGVTKLEALTLLYRVAGGGSGDADAARAWLTERIGKQAEDSVFEGAENRLDFVRLMYLALGREETAPNAGFVDLTEADAAVNWAVAKGVTNGTGPDTFSPNEALTREQVVTMLYRYCMAADGYVTRPVPVFRETLTNERAALRFYSDLPSVPYISISDYYAIMLPGAVMKVEQNGSSYTLTSQTGTATVDTERDVFSSPDISAFTNLMDQVQKGMPNVYYDGVAFAAFESAEYDRPAATVTFDFAKYHIDIREDDGDVIFPLATLSDIYSDLFYHVANFNGVNFYVNDDNHYPADKIRDEHFFDPLLSGTERAADMAEFNYNELCFAVENNYGYPGRAPIEEAMAAKGLDAALAESWPEIRQQLKSTDLYEYLVGQTLLMVGPLFDGGHTAFAGGADVFRFLQAEERETELNALMEKGIGEAFDKWSELYDSTPCTDYEAMQAARDAAYGEGATYFKKGDTVVFVLDDFVTIDFKGWTAYCSGDGPLPADEDDYYVRFVHALEKAEADPEVKNFVLDITCNGGGSLDLLTAMTDQLIGVNSTRFYNPLTGQFLTQSYSVDKNLDGRIDEADRAVRHDKLNYAVVTSAACFSCGNLFPSVMHDNGVMLLGYRSGGGSCAVQEMCFADGFSYQLSSHHGRLVNAAGENIDGGIPVDVELFRINEDGTEDYSAFYDVDLLSREINAFYAEAEKPAA